MLLGVFGTIHAHEQSKPRGPEIDRIFQCSCSGSPLPRWLPCLWLVSPAGYSFCTLVCREKGEDEATEVAQELCTPILWCKRKWPANSGLRTACDLLQCGLRKEGFWDVWCWCKVQNIPICLVWLKDIGQLFYFIRYCKIPWIVFFKESCSSCTECIKHQLIHVKCCCFKM